ncbi:hypothetical protein Tco_1130948 [Tanacetum coccineum]
MFMHLIKNDSVLGTLKFVPKGEDNQVYRKTIPGVMINQEIKNSTAYQTYLAYSIGAAKPKKARKWKQPNSAPKKNTSFTADGNIISDDPNAALELAKSISRTEAEVQEAARLVHETHERVVTEKSTGKRKSTAASLEEAQTRKALKISRRETSFRRQTCGSSKGAGSKPKDDDVNVEMKDAEPANEGKVDREMTDTEKVDAKHEEINQEVASAKVQDEVQATTSAAPTTQKEKTDAPRSSFSRSVSSNYDIIPEPTVLSSILEIVIVALATSIPPPIPPFISHSQQSTQTTTEATTLTHAVSESKTLFAIHLRVSDLEKEVQELKQVDHSTTLLTTIKSEVSTAIKEYLGTSLGDALHKVLQRHTAEFIKEHYMEHAAKQQESQYTIKSFNKAALNEFDQKQALFKTMTTSNSFNKHPKHMTLYHALMESIHVDEDAMDQGFTDLDKKKKRKPTNCDRYKDPLGGLDQGLKKRKTSKDAEPSKKPKSTSSSKHTIKSQLKSTDKSAQVEEIVIEVKDTEVPLNLGNDLGYTDEQPNVEAAPK